MKSGGKLPQHGWSLRSFSRRSFVKGSLASVVGLVSSNVMTGCRRERLLRVANWADLIGPTTIADFEREVGCRVIYENYSANEDLFQNVTKYDVVFPSDYMVEQLHRKGLLSLLPHDKFKNIGNLEKRLLNQEFDRENRFSFPYTFWGTGLAINRSRLASEAEADITWMSLFSPAASGRVTLLDEMRYTMGMALIMDGYSVNTTSPSEIETATKSLIKLKPSVMAFVTDVKDLLIRGETSLSYAYSGDVNQSAKLNKEIIFRIPQGGGIVGIDNMCITRDAKDMELAVSFLDYLMRPDVAASLTNEMFYATANRAAVEQRLIGEDLLQNPVIFLPLGNSPNLNVLRSLDDSHQQLYFAAWERVKRA
jgi:spermidine/putrescine transport system substrate-binding protein